MSSKINSHDIENKSISNDKLENDYLNLINEVDNKIPTKTSQLNNDSNYLTSVTKTDIGLNNVDNTSDIDKPVSTAQQNALNTIDAKIPNIIASTTDITAGSTSLPANTLYLVYE